MAARDFVKQNGVWIAAVVLVGAGVFFYINGRGSGYHSPQNAYFIDEETGEEISRPATDVPPLVGKSGKPTVVREFKYSLDGGKTAKVAYLFKYDDNMKKKLEEANAAGKGGDLDGNPGQWVRSPAPGSKWVSLGSDEAPSIIHIDVPANADIRIMTP